MPQPVTAEVDVWNLALDHLVEKPLTTTADNSPYARWLGRNFGLQRQKFLQMYSWNFSVRELTLTAESALATEDFRWNYRYDLDTGDANWLRVLPPRYLGSKGGQPVPHEIRYDDSDNTHYLYCDVSSTMYVRVLRDITDYGAWTPAAMDAFSVALALRMAWRFTAKEGLRDRLQADFTEALRTASLLDAMEGTMEDVEQHDVIRVRYD